MQSPIRILVIEDDRDIRNDLCDLLRGRGLWVEDVPDGCAAIEVVRDTSHPTLVLLDPFVPGLEGARTDLLGHRKRSRHPPCAAPVPDACAAIVAAVDGLIRRSQHPIANGSGRAV